MSHGRSNTVMGIGGPAANFGRGLGSVMRGHQKLRLGPASALYLDKIGNFFHSLSWSEPCTTT